METFAVLTEIDLILGSEYILWTAMLISASSDNHKTDRSIFLLCLTTSLTVVLFLFQIVILIMTKTPSQDGQGHCGQPLPPTEVLTGPGDQDVKDTMQEPKKKKKSRGDRKAQHKRRRLRRQLRQVHENQSPTEPNMAHLQDANNDEQQIQVG